MFLILIAKTFDIGAGEKNVSDISDMASYTDVFLLEAQIPCFIYLFIFVGLNKTTVKMNLA